jgi:predicted  nucleic acid-binding Zn-ribbon protein
MNEEKLDKEIEQLKKEMEQLEKQFQNKKDDFELNDLQEFQEMVKELKKKIHEEMKKRGYFN